MGFVAFSVLYLPTASLMPPAPGERPGIVPETFKVLVVGEKGFCQTMSDRRRRPK
jgi:hypothetical protein